MDKRTIILLSSIFILLVIGMFVFTYLKNNEIADTVPLDTQAQTEEVKYPNITRIDAKHFFIDGEHTFVGEIILPTVCDLLEVDSSLSESEPENITLAFNVINNSTDCPAQETAQRFSTTITAGMDATATATFMGRVVTLNLIPAQEGEKPEEFELFIKG